MLLSLLLAITMQPQQDLNVCSVLRKPSVYRHRVIHVRAKILLALPHGAILLDEACPKMALRLGMDLPDADSTVTDLIPTILNDCSSHPNSAPVEGVFVGKLAYLIDGKINLRLRSVEKLKARPCDKPDFTVPTIRPKSSPFSDSDLQ
jgi:hypothetical protein